MNAVLTDEARKKYCSALAENLPVLRARLGINQDELAKRIGVSRNTLACIETKKREMTWTTFIALSLLFMKNEDTAPILKSINIYDEQLDNYLMFGSSL